LQSSFSIQFSFLSGSSFLFFSLLLTRYIQPIRPRSFNGTLVVDQRRNPLAIEYRCGAATAIEIERKPHIQFREDADEIEGSHALTTKTSTPTTQHQDVPVVVLGNGLSRMFEELVGNCFENFHRHRTVILYQRCEGRKREVRPVLQNIFSGVFRRIANELIVFLYSESIPFRTKILNDF